MAGSSLREIIADLIRREGPIPFDQFMEMALYYPDLGYYTRSETIIGRDGDFYTSSHLHPVFGALLGKQIEECWEISGRPDSFEVVEMGAGMGYLAHDMLDYLKGSALFSALHYRIIEPNPFLYEKQRELLKGFEDLISWPEGLESMDAIHGCFISNELLDAFPVRIVVMDEQLSEIYVGVDDEGRFHETKQRCRPEVEQYFAESGIRPEDVMEKGYRTEVNLGARDWLRRIASRLAGGFIITIDYGYPARDYYHEDRTTGTLLCYHRHEASENPYENVGEQDITAHIDFSALRRWGEELGIATLGFTTQSNYLAALGLDTLITGTMLQDPFELARVKTLIMPGGMGETHKVLIQYRGAGRPDLKGFSIRNRAGAL